MTSSRTHWLEVPRGKPKDGGSQVLRGDKDLAGRRLVFSASAGPLHPRKTTQTQHPQHSPVDHLRRSKQTAMLSALLRQHLPPVSERAPHAFFLEPDRSIFLSATPYNACNAEIYTCVLINGLSLYPPQNYLSAQTFN